MRRALLLLLLASCAFADTGAQDLEAARKKIAESKGPQFHSEAAVTESPPAAILLDLGLPDGDGLDLLRRVREWSNAPVIVLSARDREGDKNRPRPGPSFE